jgi:hypothetical protein
MRTTCNCKKNELVIPVLDGSYELSENRPHFQAYFHFKSHQLSLNPIPGLKTRHLGSQVENQAL